MTVLATDGAGAGATMQLEELCLLDNQAELGRCALLIVAYVYDYVVGALAGHTHTHTHIPLSHTHVHTHSLVRKVATAWPAKANSKFYLETCESAQHTGRRRTTTSGEIKMPKRKESMQHNGQIPCTFALSEPIPLQAAQYYLRALLCSTKYIF